MVRSIYLVFFREALGTHGRIRQPEEHKYAPKHRGGTVGDEDSLIRFDDSVIAEQRKAVSQQTTYNLLSTVHHVPVRDSLGLLISFVP